MSQSESKTIKETNVTTDTKTTIGDIGLTGQNAIDLAAVMQTGNIEQTRISATTLNNLMQTVGKTAQQLIGGSSDLVQTQGAIIQSRENIMRLQGEGVTSTLARLISGSKEVIQTQGELAASTTARLISGSTEAMKTSGELAASTTARLISGSTEAMKTSGELAASTSARLISGSKEVIQMQGEQSAGLLTNLMSVVSEFSKNMIEGASEASEELIGSAGKFVSAQKAVTTGEETDLVKLAPWLAVAAVAAVIMAPTLFKRGR